MPLNVHPPRPSDEFTIPLRPGEFFKVEDTSDPTDPDRPAPQNFLEYGQAHDAAKGLGPAGTLGGITVMAPGKPTQVIALNRRRDPVVMGSIPTWNPVSLLDRIVRKDSHG
jgi:hypothetical protein